MYKKNTLLSPSIQNDILAYTSTEFKLNTLVKVQNFQNHELLQLQS